MHDSDFETDPKSESVPLSANAQPKPAGRLPKPHSDPKKDRLRVEKRQSPAGVTWEFIHPRCARKRREDMEEVEEMVAAGEALIAREELVWLLSECPDFLEAHVHLGLIALEADDTKLARGHFGRAYELALRAIEAAGSPQPLPYALDGNKSFFEAAKGLVQCLLLSDRKMMAKDIGRRVAMLDSTDPLGIARMLA